MQEREIILIEQGMRNRIAVLFFPFPCIPTLFMVLRLVRLTVAALSIDAMFSVRSLLSSSPTSRTSTPGNLARCSDIRSRSPWLMANTEEEEEEEGEKAVPRQIFTQRKRKENKE